MNVRLMSSEEWERKRFSLLRFIRSHGERRITQAGWLRLVALAAAELERPGTAVAVAHTAGGQPAGIAFAAGYGDDACFVVVHPALRGRGICRSLLSRLADEWGRLTCRVAADNTASLAACFAAGLVAVGLESGPTGKATLRLVRQPRTAGAAEGREAASGDVLAGLASPLRR
ncbi:GNAT family N-acetyltransferase [Cohnella thermotolerans]|uniref:GNAT family N-acetyltransferase n=1 Tax=Cohnella thermotolerans TaxID=329858 RepID=UPI0004028AEA|nr:GNAT family N-acetyltransferase [Cohnella thermotolerans]